MVVLLSGCANGSGGGTLGGGKAIAAAGQTPAPGAGSPAGPGGENAAGVAGSGAVGGDASAASGAGAAGLPANCQPYERTELFFGTTRPGRPPVSDQEFSAFLDGEVTPRFPDGLTMMSGYEFRGSSGKLSRERSMLVILLYPRSSAADSGSKIEDIRRRYERKFNQQSVLRADDPEPRCVTF